MRILVVDNNIDPDSWGASELRARAAEARPGAVIHARRGPADDLPRVSREWDAIIVSGSKTRALDQAPWISHLDEFLREAVEASVPVLGVCYGHQALARALGGQASVREAALPEFGWTEIERLEPSPLLEGLDERFRTYSWHRDEVASLPPHTRLLARSSRCAIQAFAVEDRPAFGIQFHPERQAEAGERSLARLNRSDAGHIQGRRKLHRDEIGRLIFSNFLNKIAKTK
jgi:GMP synthase (glutamine-hydrolysing)